jgi:hypothetical protein
MLHSVNPATWNSPLAEEERNVLHNAFSLSHPSTPDASECRGVHRYFNDVGFGNSITQEELTGKGEQHGFT